MSPHLTAHASPHGRALVVTTTDGHPVATIRTGRRRIRNRDRRAAVALVRAMRDVHDLTGGVYR